MSPRTLDSEKARAMAARRHGAPRARDLVLREMGRDLRSGAWDPIGDDLRLRDVTYFPPDTTPTAAEWLSAMED